MIVCFTGDDALVGLDAHHRAIGMFVVAEADVAAIRAVFNQGESCQLLSSCTDGPRGHRQREGVGLCPDHRRVDAKAGAATRDAAAPPQRHLAWLSSMAFSPVGARRRARLTASHRPGRRSEISKSAISAPSKIEAAREPGLRRARIRLAGTRQRDHCRWQAANVRPHAHRRVGSRPAIHYDGVPIGTHPSAETIGE